MIATTHGRLANARQPPRRSSRTDDPTRTVVATRMELMSSAAAKNVTASIAIATAGLPRATIRAPIAGETTEIVLHDSWRLALACCSRLGLTVSLTRPMVVGR